jgi:hypothetical protein
VGGCVSSTGVVGSTGDEGRDAYAFARLSAHDGRLDTGISLGNETGEVRRRRQNKGNQTWTTSDTVPLESLHAAMPPNTRGSTRPSQSQNLAKPPVQQSHRPGAVTAHDNEHDDLSGAQARRRRGAYGIIPGSHARDAHTVLRRKGRHEQGANRQVD